MKFKKATIATFCAGMIFSATVSSAGTQYGWYKKLIKKEKIGTIKEYYTEDLTVKMLKNRGDSVIVEKIIGEVVNKRKDGRVLETGGYISYRSVKDAKKGDKVLTMLFYEPNGAVDEVVARLDFVIDD